MSEVLLTAEGIQKSFFKGRSRIDVVKGIDLEIKEGEMVAIMGPSGVGKSTLLHILGTLEPPTAGIVRFGPQRKDLSQYSENELSTFRNRSLGFVFQFHYLLSEFSALENVMMPAMIAGHVGAVARKQASELLKFVGLEHRLEHRPSELSGGEQQRVAIARAVILRPKLILADEPTGNLDSENSDMVLQLLTKLNETTGVSLLFVTHNELLAGKMHRILRMTDGMLSH